MPLLMTRVTSNGEPVSLAEQPLHETPNVIDASQRTARDKMIYSGMFIGIPALAISALVFPLLSFVLSDIWPPDSFLSFLNRRPLTRT